jgi:hypothetical protein
LPSSEARNLSVVARSSRSRSGSELSSQYLKTSASTEVCVSLRSITLPSSSGPKDDTVARTCAPSPPESERNAAGCPEPSNGHSSAWTRSTIFAFDASAGAAIPVTSPLMSLMNTGTPAFES